MFPTKQNLDTIEKYVIDGYISKRKHPIYDIYIYNYTHKTQYDRFWNEETINCRGLILDAAGNIVARGFSKFFNIEEHPNPISSITENFTVTEKMDGSMIIIAAYQNDILVASRGSFYSPQAMRAREVLSKKYSHVKYDIGKSYIFEIITPADKIVVRYDGIEDLIMLAILDTATGNDLPIQDLGFPIVKHYDGIKDISMLKMLEEKNKEGFVVRFESGLRLKVKFEWYKRLHKLLTGINERHIWERLKNCESLDDLLTMVPDEYYAWVKEIEKNMLHEFKTITIGSKLILDEAKSKYTERKDIAKYILEHNPKHAAVSFNMLDGKRYDDPIWRYLKPSKPTTFREDNE